MKSEQFKEPLIQIKQDLMKEISKYLVKGKLKMCKETTITWHNRDIWGGFSVVFNEIVGNDNEIALYNNEKYTNAPIISFKQDDKLRVESEIPFLMTLLDYMEMDYNQVKI